MADRHDAASTRWRKLEKHLKLRYQQQLMELGSIENRLRDAICQRDNLLKLLESEHLGHAFPFAVVTRQVTASIDAVKQMEMAQAEQSLRVHHAKASVEKAADQAATALRNANRDRALDLSVEAASRAYGRPK